MRPVVMALLFIFGSFATSNNSTIGPKTQDLKFALASAPSPVHRLQILGAYQDFLFNEMQSPRVDPSSPDFADLNEFESDILDFHFKALTATSCTHQRSRLLATSGISQDDESSAPRGIALRQALLVLDWLCAGVQ